MTKPAEESLITFKEFLESVAPGKRSLISDLGGNISGMTVTSSSAVDLRRPDILLHCDSEICNNGQRQFRSAGSISLPKNEPKDAFLVYVCRNCSGCAKTFALVLQADTTLVSGTAYKYGEFPNFGPPNSSRLISLIRQDKELFLKGRRSENQGLGIAAFAYYRRVIEDQKVRIFDEVIKVCRRLSAEQEIIDELTLAKNKTQFYKAVSALKHGIPDALLVNGQNPLMLLHDALSEGLHAQTDEECLEVATDIRAVMADFAERMGQALKDEAEVTTAVNRLLIRKAEAKKKAAAKAEPEGEAATSQVETGSDQI
jgi:hypothetical protein